MAHSMAVADSFKLLVLGNSAVGKQWFTYRFVNKGEINFQSSPIIGGNFRTHEIVINNDLYRLEIWLCSGLRKAAETRKMYYGGTDGVFILFDVTDRTSFEDVERYWLPEINGNLESSAERILVATKCDAAPSSRVVSFDEIQELAEDHNLQFIETSAKTDSNVEEAFRQLIANILYKKKYGQIVQNLFDENNWTKSRQLGRGQFGIVYLLQAAGLKVSCAVKEIWLESEDKIPDILKEVEIMRKLDPQYIVQYFWHNVRKTPDGIFFDVYMEYMPGGTLLSLIKKHGSLSETESISCTFEILKAVKYLHERNVIHRDLKPGNILIGQFGQLKLGTPNYMSPETVKGNYGRKCDVWSIGCITYEMLTGNPPWSNVRHIGAIFNKLNEGETPELPKDISPELEKFLSQTFLEENERPSCDALLQDLMFKGVTKRRQGSGIKDPLQKLTFDFYGGAGGNFPRGGKGGCSVS